MKHKIVVGTSYGGLDNPNTNQHLLKIDNYDIVKTYELIQEVIDSEKYLDLLLVIF